jgi:hypothetical protein
MTTNHIEPLVQLSCKNCLPLEFFKKVTCKIPSEMTGVLYTFKILAPIDGMQLKWQMKRNILRGTS